MKRPSAEWSKSLETLIGRHLANIDPSDWAVDQFSCSSSWHSVPFTKVLSIYTAAVSVI